MTVRLGDNTAVELDVVATFQPANDFRTLLPGWRMLRARPGSAAVAVQ